MKKYLVLFILCCLNINLSVASQDSVTSLPGLHDHLQQPQYAGYANNLFYWYVAAKNHRADSPLIIWTSGGPGTSSLYGFFSETGPYQVDQKGNINLRQHAWSDFADYLIIEQPAGIGLSFVDHDEYPRNPAMGNQQYYQALQSFFELHPDLRHRDVYLSGESYGASYIAMLAQSIQAEKVSSQQIRLKGLIIISGWLDPVTQYSNMASYGYEHGLLSKLQQHQLEQQIEQCKCCAAKLGNDNQTCYVHCNNVQAMFNQMSGLDDTHDIGPLKPNEQLSDWLHSPFIQYLNRQDVRTALHALPATKSYKPMTDIYTAYGAKTQRSVLPIYKELYKQHVPLLFFSGLDDASPSGYSGTLAWLNKLVTNSDGFWQDPPAYWRDRHQHVLGYKQTTTNGLITWVKVLHAGHVIPEKQPKIAELVQDFVY